MRDNLHSFRIGTPTNLLKTWSGSAEFFKLLTDVDFRSATAWDESTLLDKGTNNAESIMKTPLSFI